MRAEVLLTRQLQIPRLTDAWLGSTSSTCSVDLGMWRKCQINWCVRCDVLDTKFGPQYVVTKRLVLTRIRQDVAAGKMCRMNGFASTTTNLVLLPRFSPPVPPSLTCFIVLARLGFWNTRVIRGCGPCPKSRPFRGSPARPGPWRTSASLDHYAESELCSWLGTWTAGIGTVFVASALGQVDVAVFQEKHVHPKKGFRITLRVWFFA